ncbi:hypothetical protein F4677DRAFT_5498 [Hypoxylon crocopeplum]|nr:hypothetical protein F4677DRAFT_5498 [Hypoxylon crocopeplum]
MVFWLLALVRLLVTLRLFGLLRLPSFLCFIRSFHYLAIPSLRLVWNGHLPFSTISSALPLPISYFHPVLLAIRLAFCLHSTVHYLVIRP